MTMRPYRDCHSATLLQKTFREDFSANDRDLIRRAIQIKIPFDQIAGLFNTSERLVAHVYQHEMKTF